MTYNLRLRTNMNFTNFHLIIALLITFTNGIFAQPVLLKRTSNPVLQKAYKSLPKHSKSIDTLALPFFDDFSKNIVYPDNKKWEDNNVYINQTYGQNPPSIGVATFDIINMAGEVYPNATTDPFMADYLTSHPINLQYIKTMSSITLPTTELYYFESVTGIYHNADSLFYISGTHTYNCLYQSTTYNTGMNIYYNNGSGLMNVSDSLYYYDTIASQYVYINRYIIYNYSVADSMYLSFFYEGKGYGGNAPESTDSLVLEFKTPSTDWIHIWSVPGNADTVFKRVLIPITNSLYLKKGFQFRFYNYGSIGSLTLPSFASNVDFWNLDYVYLDINRSQQDTISPDVTFVYPIQSFLKSPLISIPWDHYKQLDTLQSDSILFSYTNLYKEKINIERHFRIDNITTQQMIINDSLGHENISPFSTYSFWHHTSPEVFFPDTSLDESTFEITLTQIAPTLQFRGIYNDNDTMHVYQIFKNYYAYDDGSAEYGIGLSGSGTENGKFAMKFTTLVPDTLRGIYMYFNQTLNNASQKYFYLTIWSDNNGVPGNIICKKVGMEPEYHGIDDFYYYDLDTAIFLTGNFYVGWIQTTSDLLNLGFDLNNDNSKKVFYNITGAWGIIPFKGTPMIRPVFSKTAIVHVPINNATQAISVYPNPATEIIHIDTPLLVSYSVYDIRGNVICTGKENTIPVTTIAEGIYFIKITTQGQTSVHKIIIHRP